MSEDERLTYTVDEAARRLGIAPSTAWKHIATGRIPVMRLGGRTLVTRAAIEGLLAEGALQAPLSAAEQNRRASDQPAHRRAQGLASATSGESAKLVLAMGKHGATRQHNRPAESGD